MKMRFLALGFAAAFLLMGIGAKAQTTMPSADPAAPDAAPFCAASVAGLNQSLDLVPNPVQKAFTCGSCSSSSCVGMAINTTCYYYTGGTYRSGRCVASSVCSDNKPQCGCTNSPAS